MGGGVTFQALAAKPGLVDAAVVYVPVSTDAADNFRHWVGEDDTRRALRRRIADRFGLPEDSPGFWRRASSVNYFGRITEPVLVQHGLDDPVCPVGWSHKTVAALRRAGKDVELLTYPGEQHRFERSWRESMERTVDFFAEHLR